MRPMCLNEGMSTDLATVKLEEPVRDELRVLKAQRGETYTETIDWLLKRVDEKTKQHA